MKPIKCFLLLGLLVASASAAPVGLIDSIVDTIAYPLTSSQAQSSARSQSVGGSFGLGPFNIGGNFNTASARAINPGNYEPSYRNGYIPEFGYRRIGESHAAASAQSEVDSLGASIGFGPFRIGGSFNTAYAGAQTRNDYDPVYVPEFGSVAQAHAQA